MKKTIGGVLAALMLCVAPASAQDFDWTGFYLGVNGGYGSGHMDIVTSSSVGYLDGLNIKLDPTGAVMGVTAGVNVQMQNVVVGVEGDLDWAGLTGNAAPLNFGGRDAILTGSIDQLATVRGRLGWATGNFLLFATAGVAAGHVNGVVTNFPTDGRTSSANGMQYGYVVGAGVEAAITDNLSVKAEYLYVDLGRAPYSLPPLTANANPTASIARVGLNYGF